MGQVLSTSISRKVYFSPPLSDLTAPLDHVRFWVNFKASTGSWLSVLFGCLVSFFFVLPSRKFITWEERCSLLTNTVCWGPEVHGCYCKYLKKVLEAANSRSLYQPMALQDLGMVLLDQRLRSWTIALHSDFPFIIPVSSVCFWLCHDRRLSIKQCHRQTVEE